LATISLGPSGSGACQKTSSLSISRAYARIAVRLDEYKSFCKRLSGQCRCRRVGIADWYGIKYHLLWVEYNVIHRNMRAFFTIRLNIPLCVQASKGHWAYLRWEKRPIYNGSKGLLHLSSQGRCLIPIECDHIEFGVLGCIVGTCRSQHTVRLANSYALHSVTNPALIRQEI
jgi:hypothetical protein